MMVSKGLDKSIQVLLSLTASPGGPGGPLGPGGPDTPWIQDTNVLLVTSTFVRLTCHVSDHKYLVSFRPWCSIVPRQASISLLTKFSWRSNETQQPAMSLQTKMELSSVASQHQTQSSLPYSLFHLWFQVLPSDLEVLVDPVNSIRHLT